MNFLNYLASVFKRAFGGPYKWRGFVQLGLSIAIPILLLLLIIPEQITIILESVTKLFHNFADSLPAEIVIGSREFIWLLPLGFILIFGIPRLLFAPYSLHRDQQQQLEPRPAITSVPAKEVAKTWRGSMVAMNRVQNYGVVQAWFRNVPEHPGEGARAENVEAEIAVFRGREEVLTYNGLWLTGSAPGHAGFTGHQRDTGMDPSFVPVKLAIVLKYSAEDECYAYCEENLQPDPHGRSERFRLTEGVYQIRVDLMGIRVRRVFRFALRNSGSSEFPRLRPARWYDRIFPQSSFGFD